MFRNYCNSIDLLEALKIFLPKLENSKLNEAKLVENINNFDKNKYIDNNDDLYKNKRIEYDNSLKNENNRNTQKLFILFYFTNVYYLINLFLTHLKKLQIKK